MSLFLTLSIKTLQSDGLLSLDECLQNFDANIIGDVQILQCSMDAVTRKICLCLIFTAYAIGFLNQIAPGRNSWWTLYDDEVKVPNQEKDLLCPDTADMILKSDSISWDDFNRTAFNKCRLVLLEHPLADRN